MILQLSDLSTLPFPENVQTDCLHRDTVSVEACYPVPDVTVVSELISDTGTVWFPKPALRCLDCGAFLPDFPTEKPIAVMLKDEFAALKLVRCKNPDCRTVLTQPYAIRMGECVSCHLKRIRAGRDEKVIWSSNAAQKLHEKRKQRRLKAKRAVEAQIQAIDARVAS